MKTLLCKRFIKFSIPRILFFGVMGIVLLALPSFVLNGAFYAVVGYLVLAGIFCIVDCSRRKDKKNLLDFASIIISAILILFGINSLVFTRYLVNVSPLYFGALLLIEGMYYLIVAICGAGALQRIVLTILSIIVFLSGAGVVVFTLGFGVDGLSGLAGISGVSSILSCAYALLAYLFSRGNEKRHLGREEMI